MENNLEKKEELMTKAQDIINDISYELDKNKDTIDEYADALSDYKDNVECFENLKDSDDEDDKEECEFIKEEMNKYEKDTEKRVEKEASIKMSILTICQRAEELKDIYDELFGEE